MLALEKTLILRRIQDKENALRGDRGRDGLNGHDFEQTPGDSEGHESLVYSSPWDCRESSRTEWLNNNNI